MGLFNNLFSKGKVSLTEQQRETIVRLFGSFTANMFAIKGNSLLDNSYHRNSEVYSVIKKIVDTTKSVPWIVEQKKYDGTWKELKNTSIHELMENPNKGKGYTWNDIEEQILIYLLCSGNVYLHGESQFNSSLIEEIDILPPNNIIIESNEDFFLPEVKYRFDIGRTHRTFEKEELAHIKFFTPSYTSVKESLYGLSPIQVAAYVVQVGNDRWEADANLLQNRGISGILTNKSQRPLTPEEATKWQEHFQKDTAGPKNFGKIKISGADMDFIQLAMSSADLQLIEKGVINLRAICNVFGLDSSLFNDPENKTYSNRTEAEKALFTNAVMPISDKISEHLTRWLVDSHFPDKTVRMRQDFSGIEVLQENYNDKAKTYISLKTSGIITTNEAREALKYKKFDGEGSELADNLTAISNNFSQNNPKEENK